MRGTAFVTLQRIVFSRSVAWLLVTLVVVPFTAPFSTCDLSMLLASSPDRTFRVVISADGRSATIEERETAQASASVLEEEQFKEALPTDAVIVAAPDVDSIVAARLIAGVSATRNPLIALRL